MDGLQDCVFLQLFNVSKAKSRLHYLRLPNSKHTKGIKKHFWDKPGCACTQPHSVSLQSEITDWSVMHNTLFLLVFPDPFKRRLF